MMIIITLLLLCDDKPCQSDGHGMLNQRAAAVEVPNTKILFEDN